MMEMGLDGRPGWEYLMEFGCSDGQLRQATAAGVSV